MLICMNCNVEYEEERKFCKYCGNPLVPKIESVSPHKEGNHMEGEPSHKKLTCPDCHIVYEFGTSCIKCGATLTTDPPSKEKPKTDYQNPPSNLICPSCKIIYEHGYLCEKCGSALMDQASPQTMQRFETTTKVEMEEKPIPLQTIQEQLIEDTPNKLICTTCKIIYEHGDSCVRCGKKLTAQLASQQSETPERHEIPEIHLEGLLLQNLEEKNFKEVKQIPEKEIQVPAEPKVEMEQETGQTEIPEQHPKRPTGDFEKRLGPPQKPKMNYRRLFFEAGSVTIMVLAGGYFLWSIFTHLIIKEPIDLTPSPQEVLRPALPNSLTPANATATVPISQEPPPPPVSDASPPGAVLAENKTAEIKKIKDLLENIRLANLKKNIDLFLSCYTSDFKDREVKKKTTLDNWKRFDYLDLTYELKNPLVSGDTAKAKVEWLIKISSRPGGHPQENKAILDVTLKKEEGTWKIKEVK